MQILLQNYFWIVIVLITFLNFLYSYYMIDNIKHLTGSLKIISILTFTGSEATLIYVLITNL